MKNYDRNTHEIVLVNANSGTRATRRRVDALFRRVCESGLVIYTRSSQETEKVAARASGDGISRLVVVGGDGTLHHAVNGLLSVPDTRTKLAILPRGTANDYVATLRQVTGAIQSRSTTVDVGLIESGTFQRYFLNVAGLGLTAHTAQAAKPAPWLPARVRYTVGLMRTLVYGWKHFQAMLQLDMEPVSTKNILTLSIAIGQREGSYTLAPTARIDDGRFNVLLATDLRRRDVLRYLPGLMVDKLPQDDRRVEYLAASRVTLTPQTPVHLHLDGEVYGNGLLEGGEKITVRHAARLEVELIER
ncbi:MAG: hypothetical protein JNL67_17555 [Planctomycetaceae bacterium]|nr:hypothetical protein [Planctomycetaceae bacterium]